MFGSVAPPLIAVAAIVSYLNLCALKWRAKAEQAKTTTFMDEFCGRILIQPPILLFRVLTRVGNFFISLFMCTDLGFGKCRIEADTGLG